ncbi:oxidoreductase [Nocardia sp. NRRL S-836]|uniref:oxidoreductase n=1 Tax=Nocardia sp. NRRL S-836 TaxID=1519492 RepID=UPI0006B03ABA|nr:oxidoreductase [Nocardia sp. NRRL S-836]KOV85096.1 oxidoreductase [Nocardia sp. NRRL S-836]
MRIIAAALAALVLLPGVASADDDQYWELKPTGTDARLRGLSAVNGQVAWVSGSKGTVLRTTNGGRSWEVVAPPDTATLDFRDIQAFDARNAVVLSIGEGESSRLYRTSDGGRTWQESFRNTDPKAFYDCMAFFDRFRGLALSDPVDGKFRVLRTWDGGRSWHVNDPKGMPDALPGEFAFAASGQCVATPEIDLAGNHAWIATGGGAKARVFQSADGGRTWRASEVPMPSGEAAGVFAVAFKTPWRGVAIGGDYLKPTDPTPAFATNDGRGWKAGTQAPIGYRSGIAYRGSGLVAVGPSGTDTSRDGRTWRVAGTGSFDTVDCTGLTCWAAGEKGRVGRH